MTDKQRCSNWARHTKCPDGYLAWHAWAEKKLRTHYQVRCPGCGLLSIWKKREKPLTKAEVDDLLYPPDAESVTVTVNTHGQVVRG